MENWVALKQPAVSQVSSFPKQQLSSAQAGTATASCGHERAQSHQGCVQLMGDWSKKCGLSSCSFKPRWLPCCSAPACQGTGPVWVSLHCLKPCQRLPVPQEQWETRGPCHSRNVNKPWKINLGRSAKCSANQISMQQMCKTILVMAPLQMSSCWVHQKHWQCCSHKSEQFSVGPAALPRCTGTLETEVTQSHKAWK